VNFRQVKRERIPLLLGVAGGTGSGKTYSAMLLARGLANGSPFAFVDTENGRGKHYADLFPEMRYDAISAPFRPDKYADAIEAGAKDHPVVVVDSMSHEWAGDGGCLDWHDEIQKGDPKKSLMAWIEPKKAHKRMVTRLLQVDAHVVLCFRAEPKVEVGPGNTIIPKPSLTGLDGWIPISEKMLPYELTASFLLMADRPGFPKPIKLQEQHRSMVPLDQPLSEETGGLLAAWAAGASASEETESVSSASGGQARPVGTSEADTLADTLAVIEARLLEHAQLAGTEDTVALAIEKARQDKSPVEFAVWLRQQGARLEAKLAGSAA
jgi:hypothetical protein